MRVGIDGFRLTGKKTGKEAYVRGLLITLFAIDSKNEYILFIREQVKYNFPDNVKLVIVGRYSSYTFWNQVVLPFTLLNQKLDRMLYMESMLPFISSVSSILFIMDLSFIIVKNDFNKKAAKILNNSIKWGVKKADNIIAISESTKKDLERLLKVKPSKIEVIYPTLSTISGKEGGNKQDNEDLNYKFGINSTYILAIGSTYKYKNLARLIQAFKILKIRQYHETLQLVIIGQQTTDLNESNGYQKQNDIIFTGYVSDNELNYILQHAKVFVFPSLYEGFGIPVLEAMALSIPTVVSNISSLPEVLGDAGLVFDPLFPEDMANKIETLLVNKGLREKCIEKGHMRLKYFHPEKEAKKLLAVINKIEN